MKKILLAILVAGAFLTSSTAYAGFQFRSLYTKSVLGKRAGTILWNASQNNRFVSGLTSLWSFNGPDVDISTGVISDRISSMNGTIINMTTSTAFVTGAVGQAIQFRGGSANNVITIPDNATLRPAALTLSAWFSCPNFAIATAIISKPVSAAPWSSPFTSWLIRINSRTSIEFGINSGSYTGTAGVVSLATSTWTHVAMSYTSGAKIGYVNGAQVSSVVQSGAVGYGSFPVLIGGDHGASPYGDLSSCIIDDVRLYSRVLSADEIRRMFLAGK